MDKHCLNCESSIKEEFKYCPECGQRTKDKLTVGILFNNLIHNYFSVDARLFRSFLPLVFKPGFLTQEYIEGRRLKFIHPVQLYLFVSIVFFFIFSLGSKEKQANFDASFSRGIEKSMMPDSLLQVSNTNPAESETSNDINLDFDFDERKLDSLIRINASQQEKLEVIGLKEGTGFIGRYIYNQVLRIYEQRGRGILAVFYDSIPLAVFFLLPLFALFLKLLFFKKGPYSYHLVYSFYYFSFIFIVFSIFVLTGKILDLPGWVNWILLVILTSYLYMGILKFYKIKWGKALYKISGLLLINTLFLIPLAFFIIFIMTLVFY